MRNVAILIFNQVEVLDFAGPLEVFGVTASYNDPPPFRVYTVAETAAPITARQGLSVNPNYAITNCPLPDIIIVPGGRGVRTEVDNSVLIDWIRAQHERTELTLSVCTGAWMLAKVGALDGLSATTHHAGYDRLAELAPNTTLMPGERFVDNGKVVTSAGVSAGIDMSLHIVARLLGDDVALATATVMEYEYWQPVAQA
ncbi:MAG: DJ-1/PfpI family protein [Chloroflexi bacterium]|nr:MAG: DJ-1/PfpI family protein [Chloroflexota bacterium]